jgi:hypothetical protein
MRKTGWITLTASGLLIAACGSSSDPNSSRSGADPALKLARCMRAHGVSNFPDPSPGGGIQIGPGIDPSSPAFKAAQASCRSLLPGGGPGSGHPSAQDKAQMLQMSECMRQHGISGFPDPTLSPPANPAGHGLALGRNGVFLVIPQTIDTQSPAFKRAAAACQFPVLR